MGMNFIIKDWWHAVTILGAMFTAIGFLLDHPCHVMRHIAGLGIGIIIIGIASWMSIYSQSQRVQDVIFTSRTVKYNRATLPLLVIGCAVFLLFLVLVVIDLI